jgi:serine/threonine protein kinase
MVLLACLYKPPIAGHSATCMMDIFSLGCVCYYMLTRGRHPFGEEDNREVSTSFASSHSQDMSVGGNFHRQVISKNLICSMVCVYVFLKLGRHPFEENIFRQLSSEFLILF